MVITMLKKKGKKTRINSKVLVEVMRFSRKFAVYAKKPTFCSPLITAIRLNKRARVFQSMYDKYAPLGGTKKQETTAKRTATHRTVSCRIQKMHVFAALCSICQISFPSK